MSQYTSAPAWCIDGILSLPYSYLYMPYATQSCSQVVDVAMTLFNVAATRLSKETVHNEDEMVAACGGVGYSMQHYIDANGVPALGQQDLSSDVQASKVGALPDVDDNNAALPNGYKRTKEGIERFFITDINNPAGSAQAQSTIPIMWDAWMDTGMFSGFGDNAVSRFNHVPGGSNVLYMDGHSEFIKYKAKFPVANSAAGTAGANLSTWMSSMAGID